MYAKRNLIKKIFNVMRDFGASFYAKTRNRVKVRDSISYALFTAFIAVEILTLAAIVLQAYQLP